MEVIGRLSQDTLLSAFFNEYLSMEVFGVQLSCENECIHEIGSTPLPGLQGALWNWCSQHRWAFFLKSRTYIEYRLCVVLFPASQKDSSPVVSPEPAAAPWGQQEDSNWLQTTSEQTTQNSRYENYKQLKVFLSDTHGNALVHIWLGLEAWQVGVATERRDLDDVREQCLSVPGLSKLFCNEPEKTDTWVKAIKEKCEDRLFLYWLPRFKQKQRGQSSHLSAKMSYEMSCDPNEPFRRGLICNRIAGHPFENYLERSDLKQCIHWVKFWEALDSTLLAQQYQSDQYVVREGWKLWSLYIDDWHGDCGDSLDVYIPRDYKESLLKSLTVSNRTSAVKDLSVIQDALLSSLKRVWTQFLRLDHLLFTQCVNSVSLLENNDSKPKLVSAKKSRRSRRHKRGKGIEEWMLDLKGTVLEPLGDFETLLCFEQHLFTECGPKSQPNINYQLWKLLRTLDQTTEHKKRDSIAVHIYQNFLYLGAKRFLHLPDCLLGEIDNKVDMARPSSPTLKALSEFSSTCLQTTVKKFIAKNQDFSSNKSLDSLPAMQYLRNSRRKKISSAMQQRNEAQHLLFTLIGCEGPISQHLKAFSKFLGNQSPSTQQGQLLNNVGFWLEVKKFKAMFASETSIRVLFHKAEAIIDRYLDTASQPWIKVTAPSDLTVQVVSALGDLQKFEVYAHLERLHQLLVTAQDVVFEDMAPYWGTFCSQYTSPDGSTLSIPNGRDVSPPPRSQRSTLQLPPIIRPVINTPLLSFSSLHGLQWRTPF